MALWMGGDPNYLHPLGWPSKWAIGPSQIPMIFSHVSFSAPTRSSSRRPSARSNRSAKGGKLPYKRGSSFPPRSSSDVFFVADLCCRDAAKHTKTRWFLLELCYVDTIFWKVTLQQWTYQQTFGFKVEDQKNAEILGFPRSDVLTRWRPISGHHLRCSLPNKHWDAHKASWTEPLSLETGSKNNISKGKITVNTSIAVSGSLNRW